jgi:hypothetical protein
MLTKDRFFFFLSKDHTLLVCSRIAVNMKANKERPKKGLYRFLALELEKIDGYNTKRKNLAVLEWLRWL